MEFVLIGIGYIAKKHLEAIKAVGGTLIAAVDIKDGVGVLDQYFPDCKYFRSLGGLSRFLKSHKAQYGVVCTPNHLHKEHIDFVLSHGMKVICEKPLCVSAEESKDIASKDINVIHQLRQLPVIPWVKEYIKTQNLVDVSVQYITPRGDWYFKSWKGNENKSGGILVNIGVHLFDLLIYLFGHPKDCGVYQLDQDRAKGYINFKKARTNWDLSVNSNDLPTNHVGPYRCIKINNDYVNLNGISDLHTEAYKKILCGEGIKVNEARKALELIDRLKG